MAKRKSVYHVYLIQIFHMYIHVLYIHTSLGVIKLSIIFLVSLPVVDVSEGTGGT